MINQSLNTRVDTINDLLPQNLAGQGNRLIKRAMMTFAERADLHGIPAEDFLRCVLKAAEIGLPIDGRLCHVVRYGGKWQLAPDYKGLIAVAKRSGQIRDVEAAVVCEQDSFELARANGQTQYEHIPCLDGNPGEVIGAYAVFILPDGRFRLEWMTRAELDQTQAKSAAKNGPWRTDTNEMRKKTVIKRGLKYYLDDPGLVDLLDQDDAEYQQPAAPAIPAGPPIGRQSLRRSTPSLPPPEVVTTAPETTDVESPGDAYEGEILSPESEE